MLQSKREPLLFCLMGPTASGKTDLACELATRFPFEIISVDSAMIYRDMNIGTAKPSAQLLAQIPHHLIDILNPDASYSVANFCDDVAKLVEAIEARGNLPLLVGGSMMYFRALQQGLSALPTSDAAVRETLTEVCETQGLGSLYEELIQVDKKTALRLHPHDKQRILRALEVYRITKTPLSDLLATGKDACAYSCVNLLLMPKDRLWLHQRIAHRFEQMLAAGLIDEVAYLVKKWSLNETHPSMRSVGYRQVLLYLQGAFDKENLQDKGVFATRQLAKRQLTWLRQWPDGQTFIAEKASNFMEIVENIQQVLDNREKCGENHV